MLIFFLRLLRCDLSSSELPESSAKCNKKGASYTNDVQTTEVEASLSKTCNDGRRRATKSTTQHHKGREITYLKRMMMVDGMLDLVLVVVSLVLVLSSFVPEFQDACGGPSLLFSLL